MKTSIIENLHKPEVLEKLYRTDSKGFEKAFTELYTDIADREIAAFWKTRLEFNQAKEGLKPLWSKKLGYLVISVLVAGLLIKMPQLFGFSAGESYFYQKYAALIVFFVLSLFSFLLIDAIKLQHVIITVAGFVVSAVYSNLLPAGSDRDSVNLAYAHLPLMIWCLYGLVYIGFDTKDLTKRMNYLKYNGDIAILVALIAIAGGILTGVTIGLFSAIDIRIEDFYMEHIVIWGAVSAPVVATFIIRNYPHIADRIAPVIASIFSPLVLITLIVYLVSIVVTGKDPYNDRDFLLVFNLMLLGVMALVVFSVSEISVNRRQRFNEIVLLALTVLTLVVDLVALSAIIYRLGEFGFTPNRTAVLGANLLIFGNLVLIMIKLAGVNFRGKELKEVEKAITGYLPVYAAWAVVVVFAFPVMFGWR